MAEIDDAPCADEIDSFHLIDVPMVNCVQLNPMVGCTQLNPMSVDQNLLQDEGLSQGDSHIVSLVMPEEADGDIRSVDEPVAEFAVEDVDASAVGSIGEPVVDSAIEPIVDEPNDEPVVDFAIEFNDEPVVDSAIEPAVDPIVEPIVESVVDSAIESADQPVTNMSEYVALALKFRNQVYLPTDEEVQHNYDGMSEFHKLTADFVNRTKRELAESLARLRSRTPMTDRMRAHLESIDQRRNEMALANQKKRERKMAEVMTLRAKCANSNADLQDDTVAIADADIILVNNNISDVDSEGPLSAKNSEGFPHAENSVADEFSCDVDPNMDDNNESVELDNASDVDPNADDISDVDPHADDINDIDTDDISDVDDADDISDIDVADVEDKAAGLDNNNFESNAEDPDSLVQTLDTHSD